MKALNRKTALSAKKYPEKIIQYGEGNFLRAFFDWIVYQMNVVSDFNSGITVVQPIEKGLTEVLSSQDGLYHLCLQGIDNGKLISDVSLIDSIQRAINPYTQHKDYIQLAENPELRFLVSNTTEAGIAFENKDTLDMQPQNSFPGKVAAFLYHRYKTFAGTTDKGFIIFCCELIDRNGDKLKQYVLQHAQEWALEDAFTEWVNNANVFCNTLVDRIVPGFPKDKIEVIHNSLDYQDQLVVEGEFFHIWVIEAPDWVEKEFPAQKAGLNVVFTDDLTPYRDLKVRILNGAHTASFAVSLLSGVETVQESIEHPQIGQYIRELVFNEICPGINLPENDSHAFAEKTLERFYNPYIKHRWLSISLNSTSKWQTRVLPSLLGYHKHTEKLPARIVFSLAALISYYRGQYLDKPLAVDDTKTVVEYFKTAWLHFDGSYKSALVVTVEILGNRSCWKTDLNNISGLTNMVAVYILDIQKLGIQKALTHLLESE